MAWAVPAAQSATERVLNQHHALDDTHPLVKHVLYLDAVSPDDQPWLFDGDHTFPPVLVDMPTDQEDRRVSAGWSWVVVAASVSIVMAVLVLLWQRRRRNNTDNEGDTNNTTPSGRWGGRRRHPERITRGYMAYPSPDPSPQRRSVWMSDNPAVPSSDTGVYVSDNPSWGEEPVSSFDPVIGPTPMLMSSVSDENNHIRPPVPMYFDHVDAEDPPQDVLMHHGSFPVAFPNDIPPPAESVIDDDDVEFSASFCDDDDDESGKWRANASSPDSGWIRDLV